MQITSQALRNTIKEAALGTAPRATVEQSDCLCFIGKKLITFNQSIMVTTKNPLGFDAIVNAADLLAVLEKFPDDTLDITKAGNELVVKGRRREASLVCAAELTLPVDTVPGPVAPFNDLPATVPVALLAAARICGRDAAQFLTTCVHITPERVEACDNHRFLRVAGETGFESEVLIPAVPLLALRDANLKAVSHEEESGWVYFQTGSGAVIAVSCAHDPYHDGVDTLLETKGTSAIELPETLGEVVERAAIATDLIDATVSVKITENEVLVSSRKDSISFKERKRIDYDGPELDFNVTPAFLKEILSRSHKVLVGRGKLHIITDNTQFVVALAGTAKKQTDTEEQADKRRSANYADALGAEVDPLPVTDDDIPF